LVKIANYKGKKKSINKGKQKEGRQTKGRNNKGKKDTMITELAAWYIEELQINKA
jgi:hypothetical protein